VDRVPRYFGKGAYVSTDTGRFEGDAMAEFTEHIRNFWWATSELDGETTWKRDCLEELHVPSCKVIHITPQRP